MRKWISFIIAVLFSGCFNTALLAADNENHIVRVTLLNETNHTLHFLKVIDTNPGNQFTVTPKVIAPGQTMVMIAAKQLDNDIFGHAVLIDQHGTIAIFTILDQQQIHYGQPIFKVNGKNYTSQLISKTRNKNVGPHYLCYLAASLKLASINKEARSEDSPRACLRRITAS